MTPDAQSYAACPPGGKGPFPIVIPDILVMELTSLRSRLLSGAETGAANLPHAKVSSARLPADKAR
jgi:hypothetical protein